MLRRHVVERCIYAVDVDPLAVELCRLSLWIETMDRELPFGFLDHKVKCGNALIGAWFDQFQSLPGDGVEETAKAATGATRMACTIVKGARTKALKAFVKERHDARSQAVPERPDSVPGRPAGAGGHRPRSGARQCWPTCTPSRCRTPPSGRAATAIN